MINKQKVLPPRRPGDISARARPGVQFLLHRQTFFLNGAQKAG